MTSKLFRIAFLSTSVALLASGCVVATEDEDPNVEDCQADCEDAHAACVLDCDESDGNCTATCDSTLTSCLDACA